MAEEQPNKIWGEYSIPEGKIAYFKIGPLRLWLSSLSFEWKLQWDFSENPFESDCDIQIPFEEVVPNTGENRKRFGLSHKSDKIILSPSLGDRPIVIRPKLPFYLPKHEEVYLFVRIPLWLRIYLEDSKTMLDELPVFRLSDTWFGPSTQEGEICYAAYTAAHLRSDELPVLYHRVFTVINLRNSGDDSLLLDRIKLPVKLLSLFQTDDGEYYTETIIMEREKSGEKAKIHLTKTPHESAGKTKKILGPRIPLNKNLVTRAIHSLFG